MNAVEKGTTPSNRQFLANFPPPVIPLANYRPQQGYSSIRPYQYQTQQLSYNRFGDEPTQQNINTVQSAQSFQHTSIQTGSNPPLVQSQHQVLQTLNGQPQIKQQYQYQSAPQQQQFTNSHQKGPVQSPPVPQPQPQPQRPRPTQSSQSVNRGNVEPVPARPTFQTLYPNYQSRPPPQIANTARPIVAQDRFSFNEGAAYEVNSPARQQEILGLITPNAEQFALDFFTVNLETFF